MSATSPHDDDSGVIIPMDSGSIQRIVAGQAVTDLASAVKELVDNALDAGAKSINIRLLNQGMDGIEVSDDGSGVPVASRPYLARKHATSKIRSFDEIYQNGTTTLGFRGEALFCLANLSEKLVVSTRTCDDPIGQRMEYGHDGEVTGPPVPTPRKVGTTVLVQKLFHALPVRRADMMKRIKAQRAKVVSMIQGYGILCTGVRFNLIDTKGNSQKDDVKLSTMSSSTTVEQTISSVLGSRFLSGLTPVSVDLSAAVHDDGPWSIQGFVSKAPSLTARDGSVAREMQFFSINGRPVDLPKIARTLGDAWRAAEGKKRPACVLQFTLPKNAYDVNLSPDKREVLLTHQEAIGSLLYEAVNELWSSPNEGSFAENAAHAETKTPSTDTRAAASIETEDVPPTSGPAASEPAAAASESNTPSPLKRRKARRRNAFVHDFSMIRLPHQEDELEARMAQQQQQRSAAGVTQSPEGVPPVASVEERRQASQVDPPPVEPMRVEPRQSDEERRQWTFLQSSFNQDNRHHQQEEINALKERSQPKPRAPITPEEPPAMEAPKRKTLTLEDFAFRPASGTQPKGESTGRVQKKAKVTPAPESPPMADKGESSPTEARSQQKRALKTMGPADAVEESIPKRRKAEEEVLTDKEFESREPEKTLVWSSFEGTEAVIKATKETRFSMRQFRRELQAIARSTPNDQAAEAVEGVGGIDESDSQQSDSQPSDTQASDSTEKKSNVVSLSKDDFRGMTIIGQFNLGFILAKCRNNHLWILDQHACDEKYNFEKLCENTVIHEQKLIAPMPLELSPSEESCILENMNVFEENGFRFSYSPDKPPRHRLALTALPHSGAQDGRKAVQFGKEDVHTLCAMLTDDDENYTTHDGGTGADGTGTHGNNAVRRYAGISQSQGDTAAKVIARLPKAIAMFANRACRGSIMIGTALSQKEMETVVKRLANVDHPWNCPHGRPTMRHVKDLMGVLQEDERKAAAHIAGPTVAVMTQTQPSLSQTQE